MIKLLCTNKLKSGPEFEMIKKLHLQIRWPLDILEFQSKKKLPHDITKDETDFFQKNTSDQATLIILDEHGKDIKSIAFANMIQSELDHAQKLCFIIGGANGIAPQIKQKATYSLSFGKATWPHLLCRVMLIEQIYRAQSILNNHPYHREGSL